jgi:glucose/arabinose dehydrogenase
MPDAGAVEWRVVVSELENPVLVTSAGDGSGRLFVVEKVGIIRVIQNGDLLTTPFLDIRDRIGSRSSEQGLLGLAFHPGYAENGRFFLNYTDTSGDTIIARYLVSAVDANQAEPSSETRLLKIDQPYANHNGGVVAFGKDGYLYLGLGDGGSAGDPQNLAQSLQTLLGKILRIDVDSDEPYAVPPENSFSPGQLAEIWAYGLRNPWRFSFDRVTGDLFMGDVGQNQWEEINFLPAGSPAGANFGWKYNEGTHPYSPDTPPAEIQLTPPVFEYSHALGCSVTGGVVYRGEKLPDWNGVYLFSDFCSGTIWGLFQDAQGQWVDQVLFTNQGQISSFGEDDQGEVYVIDYNGRILRLERK